MSEVERLLAEARRADSLHEAEKAFGEEIRQRARPQPDTGEQHAAEDEPQDGFDQGARKQPNVQESPDAVMSRLIRERSENLRGL